MVKRVENVIIDSNTAHFLRSLVSELAEVACELGDEVYEVDNLREAIEEFLDSGNVRVEQSTLFCLDV